MKKFFLNLFLIFCLLLSFALECCYGADIEPWGAWVTNLPQRYLDCHYNLAQQEIELNRQYKDALRDSERARDRTTHALFRLRVYDRETHEIMKEAPMPSDPNPGVQNKLFSFPSGEYMFGIDPSNPQAFVPKFWKHRKKEGMNKKKKGVTTILSSWPKCEEFIIREETTPLADAEVEAEFFRSKVDQLCEGLKGLVEVFDAVKEVEAQMFLVEVAEEEWKKRIACKKHPILVPNTNVDQETEGHIYDSEQVIMTYVDHLINLLLNPDHLGYKFLTANDRQYYLGFHLHTSRDMCPFCLHSLHMKIREWNGLLEQTFGQNKIVFLATASNRTPYDKKFSFLSKLYPKTYKNTMRSLGPQMGSLGEEDILTLAQQQGLVIQVALDPARLYGAQSPSSTTVSGITSSLPSGGSSSSEKTTTTLDQ